MNMLESELNACGTEFQIVGHETLFDVVFIDRQVKNYRDTFEANSQKSILFNSILRNEGILKSHAKIYPSLAISNDDLENIYFGIKKASKAI